MQVKKQQLESNMKQRTGSKLGKEYIKVVYCPYCLFNSYAECIMWKAGLEEAQDRTKIAGRNINNLRFANDITLMVESEEELKKPLDESERGAWKSWLKTQHSEN